ncbi:MAG: hypothetical protein ACQKBT_08810 [Puniceicoccales bacterium]
MLGHSAFLHANPRPGQSAGTPITKTLLDPSAFMEWTGEEEIPIQSNDSSSILWTQTTTTGHRLIEFGDTNTPGPRHLRIGFTAPVTIGTLLVRGNVSVSVLRTNSGYPGELNNEKDWIPAQRVQNDRLTTDQPEDSDLTLWVLPPETATRALRFTRHANPADPSYKGTIGGILVFSERLLNLAPYAQVSASSDNRHADKLNNETYDGWKSWESAQLDELLLEKAPVVSTNHPEWIVLNWAEPVSLNGLATIWTGFGAMDVEKYSGSNDIHPRDASDQDWSPIQSFEGFSSGYPTALWPHFFLFDQPVQTHAIRIRITRASTENHPHTQRRPAGGKRVWLGEILALEDIGSTPLSPPDIQLVSIDETHPPIPITFTLPEEGYVTLVIENSQGQRVRNLVSETLFPAGENTAWWDGTHDLDRDIDAAKHGLFNIPARFVEPGEYKARGLWRKKIEAVYEFPTYNSGNPPWSTPDHTGGWLANHSAPSSAMFVPGDRSPTGEPVVFLGAYITEGPDGFIWADLDMKKRGGMKWIGGNWTAAPYLARDPGPESDPNVSVYVASAWETQKGSGVQELRITALEKQNNGTLKEKPIYKGILDVGEVEDRFKVIRGIAAYNGVIAVSVNESNQLMFIRAKTGEILGQSEVKDPRGLVYDEEGRLYLLLQTGLIRFDPPKSAEESIQTKVIIPGGLQDPFDVAIDTRGLVYVSEWGNSHQVKVFADPRTIPGATTPQSESYPDRYVQVGAIGNPGPPKAGPYDPNHMNHPSGITIDSEGHLWVAEHDFLPKRVSQWTLDGELVNAVYGPSKYGGGGQIDPRDKSKFYYSEDTRGALEFTLDWEEGKADLNSVLYREGPETFKLLRRSSAPESAVYHNDQRYFHNSYNSDPTSGNSVTFLFIDQGEVAVPIVAMGKAKHWPLLTTPPFHRQWPEGVDPQGDKWNNPAFFLWIDQNGDAHPQPEEIVIRNINGGGVTVMDDLSFIVAEFDSRTVRFRPRSFSPTGIPTYSLDEPEVLAENVFGPQSSGGRQALADDSPEMVVTLGMKPFHTHSISGASGQIPQWSYPNPWPGLHASHHAAKPDRPGQLIGPTRLMGGFIHPADEEVGPLWALNANMGNFYLFTRDGLFVATVFADSRLGKPWKMKTAERGMSLEGLTLHDENFWPTINQTADGEVYLVDGTNSSIIRLDGLDTLRAISPRTVSVTKDHLRQSQIWVENREAARQAAFGSGVMTAQFIDRAPKIDGNLSDWSTADWVEIDKRGDGANFNSNAKPYHVLGAIRTDGRNLYAAWSTRDPDLLTNSGEIPRALFKTGGALDLMIGTDNPASPERKDPVRGDMRLLITRVDDQTKATLYRPVVPGTDPSERIPFTSPVWSLSFDEVIDVSDRVLLADDGNGDFEFAIPLSVLDFDPYPGLKTRGDIGVLRGSANQTTSRTYWSNKATGITADVPSEAKLSPHLWGTIEWK